MIIACHAYNSERMHTLRDRSFKCTVKKSEKTHVTESEGLRNQQRDKQFAKNLSNDL